MLSLDEKLVILMEECAEVAKAASKCLRFGFTTRGPGKYGINENVLSKEIGDLLGMIDSLPLDIEVIAKYRALKLEKAEKLKKRYGRKML